MEKIRLFSCLIAIFAIFACEKQYEQSTDTTVPDISVDESASAFAKILASSMNNSEMLDFIKEMADQRFDGDENFLIMDKLDDKATKSSHTFYDMLASTVTKSSGAYDLDNLVEAIKLNDPLLQVYVMNSELWDSGIEPVVVLLPENYDDERLCTLTVYQMDGKSYTISSKDEIEDAPVVVLSRNERTIVETKEDAKNTNAFLLYSNDNYNYYLKSDRQESDQKIAEFMLPQTKDGGIVITPDQTAGEIMGSVFQNCYRMINKPTTDYISKITIKDKGSWTAMESAWLGDPELELHIIYAKRTQTGIALYRHEEYLKTKKFGNRNDIKEYDWNQDIMQWSLGNNGNSMTYAWNEEDNSNGTKEYKTTYSIQIVINNQILTYNGNVSFDVGNEDNDAGESFVYYNHPYGTCYSDAVKFWISPEGPNTHV